MKRNSKGYAVAMGLAASLALTASGLAQGTVISTFNNFNLDGLFAWSDATIVSGPNSYSVTDIGYGSGYKAITPVINASGATSIELTCTLSGGPSGPIVSLVDGDGTFVNYAWYGTPVGSHVLTMDLSAGSVSGNGTVPGLDLSTLSFFHLQDDPGGFGGAYTVAFENLSLIPEPTSIGLLILGAGGLMVGRRQRR